MAGEPVHDATGAEGYERNVGGTDRVLRATAGIVFVAIAGWMIVLDGTTNAMLAGTLALIGAGILMFTAATGFCAMNAMLGLNTCSVDDDA